MPGLAMCGSAFMVTACIISHKRGCVWYAIVFVVDGLVGIAFLKRRKAE
jgi:hypothetical protein